MAALNDQWRTSTRSGSNGQCIEARYTGASAQVRDSKDSAGPVLAFAPASWTAFVNGLKGDARPN